MMNRLDIRCIAGVLALGILLPLAGSLEAQSWTGTASLGMSVKGTKGRPLSGALVTIAYREIGFGDGPAARRTDGRGEVNFTGLAEGAWSVKIDHPEHLSYLATMMVRSGKKPQIVSEFLEATGAGRQTVRIRPLKASARSLGDKVPEQRRADVELTPAPAEQAPELAPQTAAAPPTPPAPEEKAQEAAIPERLEPQAAPREPASVEPVPIETPLADETAAEPPPSPPAAEPPAADPTLPSEDTVPDVGTPDVPEPEVAVPEAPALEPPTAAPEAAPTPEAEPAAPTPPPPSAETIPEPEQQPAEMPALEPALAAPQPVTAHTVPDDAPSRAELPAAEPAASVAGPEPELPAPAAPSPPAPSPEPIPEPEQQVEESSASELRPPEADAAPPVSAAQKIDEPQLPEPSPTPSDPARADIAPEAAAVPAPSATPPAPAAEALASYRDRTCRECRPGEWSVVSRIFVAPRPQSDCALAEDELRSRIGKLARDQGEFLSDFAGPLPNARLQLEADLDRQFSACGVAAIVLPRGSRYAGYRLEASDSGGSGDCTAERTCPIGDARWAGEPISLESAGATLLFSVFHNASEFQERTATLTVYFVPAPGWTAGAVN